MIRIYDATLQAYKDIEGLRIRRPDGVLVDAQAARKLVGGTWVDVWPEKVYLIKSGNPTTLTGGYKAYTYRDSGHHDAGHDGVTPIVSSNAVFAITISRASSIKHGVGTVFFNTLIDITKYKRLYIRMAGNLTALPSGGGWVKIGFTKNVTDNYLITGAHIDHYSNGTAEVNIESLAGNYHLTIEACGSVALETSYTFKIADIWLEK